MISEDVLLYDTETKTFGKPNPEKDLLRFFGCYSYKTQKYYITTDVEEIKKIINAHKYLVGYNIKKYDNIILERTGISLKYKYIIDLYEVIDKRSAIIKTKDGLLSDLLIEKSLKYVTKILHLVDDDTGKMDFDYSVLNKPQYTQEDIAYIHTYLKRDIEVTKKLYEYLEDFFEPFKEFVLEKDVTNKQYLTSSTASYTYKVICKALSMEPDFEDVETDYGAYEGGYVSFPSDERVKGNIVMYDFSSLYPNIFLQCNLFSNKCECCNNTEKWHGDGFFKVSGYYCTKKQGRLEELYKTLFLLRKKYNAEKDPRGFVIKVLLNSGYGITANPKFKNVYNQEAASDCTAIGRQCILYTRKRFREEGYTNIMSDTDSLCLLIPDGKTIEDSNILAKKVVEELQAHMPFAW